MRLRHYKKLLRRKRTSRFQMLQRRFIRESERELERHMKALDEQTKHFSRVYGGTEDEVTAGARERREFYRNRDYTPHRAW